MTQKTPDEIIEEISLQNGYSKSTLTSRYVSIVKLKKIAKLVLAEGIKIGREEILREFIEFCEHGFRATGEPEFEKKWQELKSKVTK